MVEPKGPVTFVHPPQLAIILYLRGLWKTDSLVNYAPSLNIVVTTTTNF